MSCDTWYSSNIKQYRYQGNDSVGFVVDDILAEEEEMLNMKMGANANHPTSQLLAVFLEIELCPVTEEEVCPVTQESPEQQTSILLDSAMEKFPVTEKDIFPVIQISSAPPSAIFVDSGLEETSIVEVGYFFFLSNDRNHKKDAD